MTYPLSNDELAKIRTYFKDPWDVTFPIELANQLVDQAERANKLANSVSELRHQAVCGVWFKDACDCGLQPAIDALSIYRNSK